MRQSSVQEGGKRGVRVAPVKASSLERAVFDTLHIDLTRQGRSAGAMLILDGPDVADQGESIICPVEARQ